MRQIDFESIPDGFTTLKLLLWERGIKERDIKRAVEKLEQLAIEQANILAVTRAELDNLRINLTYHI